jgi:hypothetical protein
MNAIQKFLERKDYVGATFIAMVVAIFALWGRIVEQDKLMRKLQQDYEKQVRIATAAQMAREDKIRDEARREVAEAYRAAFQNQEERIASLEATIESLLNKTSIVNSKYNRLQRQINTVSGNQQKIEKVIR